MNEQAALRVRFAPSPTGYLHIGGARTALFNWLLARQSGGTFLLRIEDTDTDRNVADADQKIIQDLRWLGIEPSEGAGIGGPYAPYYQSQRMELYQQALKKLLDAGRAYYCFDTSEELEAMREQATAEKRAFKYPRPARFPDEQDVQQAQAAGKPVTIRFAMPDQDFTVRDEIMGDVTVAASELDDFVIRKADGMPVFHLANVVDDAAMKIGLVMRGQEFLAQTPRHMALQQALGYPTPRYAHLPLIMDMQGRKLSKRDGAVEVHAFRQAGYLPEVLANFIALLGWSPGQDRERMTLEEMVGLFGLDRVGRTNAKFDRDKLLAFNTDTAAALDEERLLAAFEDYLAVVDNRIARAGLDTERKRHLLRVNRGFRTFADIETKSGVLFAGDNEFEYDPDAVKKVLAKGDNAGFAMLAKLVPILEQQADWSHEALEALLQRICEQQQVGMGKVAQPIRVAVTGTTISPAIGETLAILGKEHTLARIQRASQLQTV